MENTQEWFDLGSLSDTEFMIEVYAERLRKAIKETQDLQPIELRS